MRVTKETGCGTSHIYTNIHHFYGAKYDRHFKKQYYYKSSLHIKKFMYRVKGGCTEVFSYGQFKFLRTVTLGGKLMRTLMPT